MSSETLVLEGRHVRLEPLTHAHAAGLLSASGVDASLYDWSPVPQDESAVSRYIDAALAMQRSEGAVPFATVRLEDNIVIGSTRFWQMERWAWPPDHPEHNRCFVDGCEIGHTWLTRSAIRTAANTEAKYLMLRHAFEVWNTRRVSLHTDVRNARSRAAIERIGGKQEGILRAHRLASDFTPRDSVRYAILAADWPEVKQRLETRLYQ